MNRTLFLFALAALAFMTGLNRSAEGYALEGQKWPSGTAANPTLITMNLQLSSATVPYPEQFTGGFFPTYGLQDFSPSWNAVAQDALSDWNQYLENAQFASNTNTLTPASGDGINSVFFASSAFGNSFGTDALAITLRYYNTRTNYTTEADVVVNENELWDSYRGALQYNSNYGVNIEDLRRVLDHEFGHVLGLDHPDLANPPQTVTAIMNSTISDLDGLAADDVSGVMFLYGVKPILEPVTVTASPTNGGTVTGGGNLQVASTQTLTAIPASGYAFVQWEDGTTNPIRNILVPLIGGSYTATFAQPLDIWTTVASASNIGFSSVLSVNGTFYAFANNETAISNDGVNWSYQTPTTAVSYYPNNVAYGNGVFVSVGYSGQVWSSTDGVNWTIRPTGLNSDNFDAVTYANGVFVAVGESTGGGATPVITSPDGINWTLQTQGLVGSSFAYSSITYGNGIFVAVGGSCNYPNDSVMTSPDGINWTTTNLSTRNDYYSVAYGNGVFVASTEYGNQFTSPDGVNWTQQNGENGYEWHMFYTNGVFLGVGSDVYSSPDGLTFTQRGANAGIDAPEGAAFADGRFVVVGLLGIYTSAVAPNVVPSTPVPMINSSLAVSGAAESTFTYPITASNSPKGYNAIGLPAGLTIDATTGIISGTPTTAGTFPVQLFATNDTGSGTATLTLTVKPPSNYTFSQWATHKGISTTPSVSTQNDGVPDILKFLCDIDPTQPMAATDRAALPTFTVAPGSGDLTLAFREYSLLSTQVVIGVQTSTDLKNWGTPSSYTIEQMGPTLGNGDKNMEIDVKATGATRQFIRLQVTSP